MNTLLTWDQVATLWINQHHNLMLDAILMPISWFGEAGVGWIAVMLLLLIFGKRRLRLLTLVLAGGLIVTEFLVMPLFREYAFRPRPYTYLPGIRSLGVQWTTTSFPSAHAHLWAQVTLLYGVAYRRWLWPLIVLSLLTFYSRPYAGAHHVLDVVGGLGLGGVMGLIEVAVANKMRLMATGTTPPSAPGPRGNPPAAHSPGSP